MKHETSHGSSRSALTVKSLIGGVAAAALLGLSINAQAQTCVVSNWSDSPGLSDADAGTQGGSNRRYGGPCGLRVPGGGAAFVTDETPSAEGSYIARFYAFLDDAGASPVVIYEATDGTDPRAQVWYNFPNAGDLTLRSYDQSAATEDLTFTGLDDGWHSIEFVWEAAASAEILFSLNGATDLVVPASFDTSGTQIADAKLGNVDGGATGPIDFDDFDSRRISRPGRLMVGDANDDMTINAQDFVTVINEITGSTFASGQPDCNEDGTINAQDFVCVINVITGG